MRSISDGGWSCSSVSKVATRSQVCFCTAPRSLPPSGVERRARRPLDDEAREIAELALRVVEDAVGVGRLVVHRDHLGRRAHRVRRRRQQRLDDRAERAHEVVRRALPRHAHEHRAAATARRRRRRRPRRDGGSAAAVGATRGGGLRRRRRSTPRRRRPSSLARLFSRSMFSCASWRRCCACTVVGRCGGQLVVESTWWWRWNGSAIERREDEEREAAEEAAARRRRAARSVGGILARQRPTQLSKNLAQAAVDRCASRPFSSRSSRPAQDYDPQLSASCRAAFALRPTLHANGPGRHHRGREAS